MRAFLIFLAVAFPIVLASPIFWQLVAMEVAVARVGYGRPDGSIQQALIGPKAPWPDWVPHPDGASLEVRAWFGPTSSLAETGYGYLTVSERPSTVVAGYVDKLTAAGWHVEAQKFQTTSGTLPPHVLDKCIIVATRPDGDQRVIRASIELSARRGYDSLHWATFPQPAWARPNQGPCLAPR